MQKLLKKLKIILLTVLISTVGGKESQAKVETKGFVKPYLGVSESFNGLLLDSKIRLSMKFDDKLGIVGSISPIELRPGRDSWNFVPEMYFFIKRENFGKVSVGQHRSSSDLLLVDPGTFAVGDFIGDNKTSSLYSPLLVNNLQLIRQRYDFKISYLSPLINERFYFGASHIASKAVTQARFFYSDSFSSGIDFKSSVGFSDNKFSGGFNLQYLGLIVGGSVGKGFYSTGLGYSIGHLKTSLTHLESDTIRSILFGMEYKFDKDLIPFIQIGKSIKNEESFALGVKILF